MPPPPSPPNGSSVFEGLSAFARSVAAWPPSADGPANPSFPLTVRDAEEDLARMAAEPFELERPLVLVGGWLDPVSGMNPVASRLGPCFRGPEPLLVHHKIFSSHRAYRDRLIERVAAAFSGGTADETVEVDVIAHSMGGLISRFAAMPVGGASRLNLRRLFTSGTCHRGAAMAPLVQFEPLARDMLPGSEHLAGLDRGLAASPHELTCYARLDDELVGTDRCSPDGFPLHWVPNRKGERAHWCCKYDPRILADIARRIRGEVPHATEPAAPLPSPA